MTASTKMSNAIYATKAQRRKIRIAKHYVAPFAYLIEWLERHIAGKSFVAPLGVIHAIHRFFVRAYEGERTLGENNLPRLTGKYDKCLNRDFLFNLSAAAKLRELYQKATKEKLEDKEVSLVAVKLLGLLDNLESQTLVKKEERRQYATLLKFGRALLRDSECQEPNLDFEDDD